MDTLHRVEMPVNADCSEAIADASTNFLLLQDVFKISQYFLADYTFFYPKNISSKLELTLGIFSGALSKNVKLLLAKCSRYW